MLCQSCGRIPSLLSVGSLFQFQDQVFSVTILDTGFGFVVVGICLPPLHGSLILLTKHVIIQKIYIFCYSVMCLSKALTFFFQNPNILCEICPANKIRSSHHIQGLQTYYYCLLTSVIVKQYLQDIPSPSVQDRNKF